MLEVGLTGALRSAAGGAGTLDVEARTIRELINKLVDRFPDMQQHVDDGIAVAIDGEIYRDDWQTEIPAGAEVFILPRVPGG